MNKLSDRTASRRNVRGLANGYETDPCEYLNALKQRIEKAFSRPDSPCLAGVSNERTPKGLEESADAVMSSLRGICKQNLKQERQGEHVPWHNKNRVKDRKMLNRLRAFRTTVGGSEFWEEEAGTEEVKLRHTGASKEHGKVAFELTCALDAEIQALEAELESNEKIWGSTRNQNNFAYNTTGATLAWVLKDYGVPYAYSEAVVFLWHSGAHELVQEVDVINPLIDRSMAGEDPRDALDSVARKRWKIFQSQKGAKGSGIG